MRLWFRPAITPYGLLRRFGSLMEVPPFFARYERWHKAAEQLEMQAALRNIDIYCGNKQPDSAWQMVCCRQYRRRHTGVGAGYRSLLGLAAAQISSELSAAGLPGNPFLWQRQEFRMFSDLIRLERWRQVVLLEELLEHFGGRPARRDLIEAFERNSGKREQRIAAWRQRALLAMMGLDSVENGVVCEQP